MADECEMLSNLNVSHSKLRTFNLRLTPNLERLELDRCYNLVELGPPIGNMKKLVHLNFSTSGLGYFLFMVKDYTSCSVDESLDCLSPYKAAYFIPKIALQSFSLVLIIEKIHPHSPEILRCLFL
uniref:Uncharacterized protein n=1 Tax=Lactuca sativa TaxID=4236 RepID=A0A9R1VZC5_LACSA|nr:hypothetical protein LSAT_V11C400215880 [Lactuca sativa]